MRLIIAAVFALLSLTAGPVRAANILLDPSFELNNGSWFGDMGGGFDLGAPTARTGRRATVTGCVGPFCTSTAGQGAFFGQTVATTAGQSYDLSFYVAETSGPNSGVSILWNNQLFASVLNPANFTYNFGVPNWTLLTFTGLTATSNQSVLEIHGRQDPGGIYFDDISLQASNVVVAVPEPATILMFGPLALAFFVIRRRKSDAAPFTAA